MAARRWYDSTTVSTFPDWDYSGTGGYMEPVNSEYRAQDIQRANIKALLAIAEINREAARWTTVAAIFAAASSISGALSPLFAAP